MNENTNKDTAQTTQRKQNLDIISKAVFSGDMTAAKAAVSKARQEGIGQSAQLQTDFDKLVEAVDMGDAGKAKAALRTYQEDIKTDASARSSASPKSETKGEEENDW